MTPTALSLSTNTVNPVKPPSSTSRAGNGADEGFASALGRAHQAHHESPDRGAENAREARATPTSEGDESTAAADAQPDMAGPTGAAATEASPGAHALRLAMAQGSDDRGLADAAQVVPVEDASGSEDALATRTVDDPRGATRSPGRRLSATAPGGDTTASSTPMQAGMAPAVKDGSGPGPALSASIATDAPGPQSASSATAAGGSQPPTSMLAAASTGQTATPSAAATAAAVPEFQVPARLDQPGFGTTLGATLSMLARDGVGQAKLHLNPADMGPVWVQIQVSGQTARVDLAAELAATRQILEQAMPTLAGSLRDSGLTLTGGGVFERQDQGSQHADSQTGQQRGARPGRGRADDDLVDPAHTPLGGPARARGVVDVYA